MIGERVLSSSTCDPIAQVKLSTGREMGNLKFLQNCAAVWRISLINLMFLSILNDVWNGKLKKKLENDCKFKSDKWKCNYCVVLYQFYEKFSKIFWHPILRDTLYNGYLQCARLIVLDVDSCRHESIFCKNSVWE